MTLHVQILAPFTFAQFAVMEIWACAGWVLAILAVIRMPT